MNLKEKDNIINTIFNNLNETKELIRTQEASELRDMVDSKFITTLSMLLEGTIGIKDGVLRDLEEGELIE